MKRVEPCNGYRQIGCRHVHAITNRLRLREAEDLHALLSCGVDITKNGLGVGFEIVDLSALGQTDL